MNEITHHELADEGFHEIQLSGKQLVFLFMATTIVAVVIFLCGVQVGRGVRTERVAESTDASAITTTPPVTATPPPTAASAGPPADAPPAPAQETDDGLTYGERLQTTVPPKEQLKPHHDPVPAPAPAPVESAPAVSTPPAAAKSAPSPMDKAEDRAFDPSRASGSPRAESRGDKAHARPLEGAVGNSADNARMPRASHSGAWVIQVHALKDRAAAAAMARRLSGKGYPAFVLDPSAGAPEIYRVQVGRYNDRREAEQIAHRLEKEEQFKPWVQH